MWGTQPYWRVQRRTAYPEGVVRLPFHSLGRRVFPATIAVLLFALVVTQAASSVCTAQCVEHQLGTRSTGATTHCQSMLQPANGAAVQTCPASTYSFCVIDLLANSQEKTTVPQLIHAELPPGALLLVLDIPALAPLYPPLRSSIGDPPLITPLRV